MTDFKTGDRVHALDPDSGEEIEGAFLKLADPDEALEIPTEGGAHKTDAAWIELEDGTTRKVVYHRMRPAHWERLGSD